MKQYLSRKKQKTYLAAGVIALTAAITMAGVSKKQEQDAKKQEQEATIMAEAEWVDSNQISEQGETLGEGVITQQGENLGEGVASHQGETPGEGVVSQQGETLGEGMISQQGETLGEGVASQQGEIIGEQGTELVSGIVDESKENLLSEDAKAILPFSETQTLTWPVEGDVILNYSMDHSVYFATLNQYKYNPAIVLKSSVNEKVLAAADGQITAIETTAETGQTVTMDLGSGYEAIYGQLKEINYGVGESVERGEVLGFVSEPTKYYSVEGSNLYFAMRKDGKPVNPMEFLE